MTLLGTLLDEVESADLHALILSVAADLLGKGTDLSKTMVVDVIRRACESEGPELRRAAAFALREATQAKSSQAVDALLVVLASTTAEELGTIQTVDGALFQLTMFNSTIKKHQKPFRLKFFRTMYLSLTPSSSVAP